MKMSAEYHRDWYQKNRAKRIRQVRDYQLRMAEWFLEYKRSLRCVRCGEDDPVCLDFHHLDSNAKDFELSAAARQGYSQKRLLEEIKKCIVLCSNCHRKEHASVVLMVEQPSRKG